MVASESVVKTVLILEYLTESRIANFWAKVEIRGSDECWPWVGARAHNGYGSFGVGDGGIATASRVAWVIATGEEVPDGLWVLHECDNQPCCNARHLFLGDRAVNMADMVAKRRHWAHQGRNCVPLGEKHGRSKLRDAEVLRIRALRRDEHWTHQRIADEFAISRRMVGLIVRGENWKHLPL